jgi:hypothetical protein
LPDSLFFAQEERYMRVLQQLKLVTITFLPCICGTAAFSANAAININDVTVTEGGAASLTVSLDAPLARGSVRVDYSTRDGSANAVQDYEATSGHLLFRRGEQTRQITLQTVNDNTAELIETFTVELSNARGDNITNGTGVVTIQDDDAVPTPVCSIGVAPTTLAFGDVNIGQNPSLSTIVSNAGDAACDVTITKTGSTNYTATPLNFQVSAGDSRTVAVIYTPTATGADNGSLTVGSNDPDTPGVDVTLTGSGVQQQVQCDPVDPGGSVSINSTSQNGCPDTTIPQEVQVPNTNYSVLAINDLGMHCGDLDTRIASILPPFQVLLAQVIRKGTDPVLNPAGVDVFYSATSNPNDPVLSNKVFDGVMANGDTYKTNFWDTVINKGVYNAFYPFDIDTMMTDDLGLPVPNLETLYINGSGNVIPGGTGIIEAVQHAMSGIAVPFTANNPQHVQEHYNDKPFFVDFPFGYVAAEVNWYEGAGIPFAAFDDNGRENAYPLVRVQAVNQQNQVLSTVDTVLPISGEASCTNCHATNSDYVSVHGVDNRTDIPTSELSAAGIAVATSLDDPDSNLPPKVSLEYAADINVLRLHDLEHGPNYVSPDGAADPCSIGGEDGDNGTASCLANKALVQNQPVVCQVCHYTPALDLAHVGPLAGSSPPANGRNQLAHQSNSRVMHNHHGSVTDLDRNGQPMFPEIDPPTQNASGVITNQTDRLGQLENSCYQCHPGTNVQCLRGAMYNADMLCSDCHGSMLHVGDDFSRDVSPSNPGKFTLDPNGNFYDPNDPQPRVPWANEPGCGSCHTGDANDNLTGDPDTMINTVDTNGNTDGIRLRMAYRVDNLGNPKDAKATPIVPTNKRFAEPAIPASFNGFANPGAGNPQLYRVSTGHGGVMCEGCHGATHAEWPNANPNSNDNVTATQLQGHTGTIVECSTCHGTAMNSQITLGGPHGMHPVGENTSFANGGHEHMDRSGCPVCHGPGGLSTNTGTVLSVAKADRNLRGTLVHKGEPVGCSTCHGGGGGD